MPEVNDLELLVRSRNAVVVVETYEEARALELFTRLGRRLFLPVFRWSRTDGLARLDIQDHGAPGAHAEPRAVLERIRALGQRGIYLLLDFHPFLDDPLHVRLLKDIALAHPEQGQTLVLLSHRLELPPELAAYGARFELTLPDSARLEGIVREEARAWAAEHPGRRVRADPDSVRELVRNLAGLTVADARRLARRVIYDDGAITPTDLPEVMRAKHALLNRDGVLAFEYDTASFAEVGGFGRLKDWLERRRAAFLGEAQAAPDRPKGVLLLGVQGSGKSLAARAVAGVWRVPLLRLDVGALYNKYHGETERNLRESLATAEVMAPCVLWIDEIEKGVASGEVDGGTSQRVLATLLTWLAENRRAVFVVATANDIRRLPPELCRKGRFDEIFFVDLPDRAGRREIFAIHLAKREQDPQRFDLDRLAAATEGFSGAEIEQVVVSALYSAAARELGNGQLLVEAQRTRPLSVVMAERIDALRQWAEGRTVPAD